MKKILLLVLLTVSAAQAQSVSQTTGTVVGGYNVDPAPLVVNINGAKIHTLTAEERKAVAQKFGLKADDKVGLVGAFYEIKGPYGDETGYNWVKPVGPDADSIMAALSAVDSSALTFAKEAMQNYLNQGKVAANGSSSSGQSPYQQSSNQALRADLKLELVVVGATWCPVCRKLEAIIASLKTQQPYQDHIVFTVIEMDQDAQAARKYGIDPNGTAPPKMFLKYNGKIVDKVEGSYGDSTGPYLQQQLRKYN